MTATDEIFTRITGVAPTPHHASRTPSEYQAQLAE